MSHSSRHLAASVIVAMILAPVAPLPVMAENNNDCVAGTPLCPKFVPKPQQNNRGGGGGGQGQQGKSFSPPKEQPNTRNGGNNGGQHGNTFIAPTPQPNTRNGGNGGGQHGNTFIAPTPQPNTRNGGNNGGQHGNTFIAPKPQPNTRNGDNNGGQHGNTFIAPTPQPNTRNGDNNGGQHGNTYVAPKPQPSTRYGDDHGGQAFGNGQGTRDGHPPQAAGHGANDFRPGDRTHEYHLGANDVQRSRDNNWNRTYNRSSGMSDFEKFGLLALGAVTIGALLSNGDRVVSNSGDRIVYRDQSGRYGVYHDDDVLIRRPGDTITTQTYDDGSVATRIVQQDGSIILTVRNANGRVLRRTVTYPDGREVLLFDDTQVLPPPVVAQLPPESPVDVLYTLQTGPDLLRAAFLTKPFQPAGRAFNLSQIRDIPQVRYLAPEVELTALAFPSGSSAIEPDQAQSLAVLGHVMSDMIAQNPAEVFLIEGHSDAVGDPAMNLALSDARAQATAMALTEYFGVPPQNLITQGYGENDLKNQTQGSDEANRRVVVRRITELLPTAGQ